MKWGVVVCCVILMALQEPVMAEMPEGAELDKVTTFLERRRSEETADIGQVVDEIASMIANGQLTKLEATSLLLLAHEQTIMEIGAIAGEKFAGLPSCGKGIAARERVEADLRRRALRHETPWRVSANAIAVMDATCNQSPQRR